jgi:hypothetical protein
MRLELHLIVHCLLIYCRHTPFERNFINARLHSPMRVDCGNIIALRHLGSTPVASQSAP